MLETPANASRDPMERSIPPAMMTKVIPSATIPVQATCLVMLIRFCGLRKCSLEAMQIASSSASARNGRLPFSMVFQEYSRFGLMHSSLILHLWQDT